MTREDLYKIVTPGHAFENCPLVAMRRMIDAGTITDDCFVVPVEAIEETICEIPDEEFVTRMKERCPRGTDHAGCEVLVPIDRLYMGDWLLKTYLQHAAPPECGETERRSYERMTEKIQAKREAIKV